MKRRMLITGFDFPPQIGGIATYTHQLATEFAKRNDLELKVIARKQSQANYCALPIEYIDLPKKATLSLPKYSSAIRTIAQSWKPHWVLNPLWFPDGLATAIAINHKITKQFIAAHGLELINSAPSIKEGLRSLFFSPLRNWTFKHSQHCFPVSHYTAKRLRQIYKGNITVIHNGVNPDTFKQIQPQKNIPKEQFSFLTVGRLKPHKGIDTFLKTFATLVRRHPHLHYYIIGTGPDEQRLRALCQDLQLEDDVTFCGALAQQEIVDYYNAVDVFVLLSREEFPHVEGFGLVLLEAGACGTPALASLSGGIPEAVIADKTALLCNTSNAADILRQTERLIEDTELLNLLSKEAYKYAQQNTWQLAANKLFEAMSEPT